MFSFPQCPILSLRQALQSYYLCIDAPRAPCLSRSPTIDSTSDSDQKSPCVTRIFLSRSVFLFPIKFSQSVGLFIHWWDMREVTVCESVCICVILDAKSGNVKTAFQRNGKCCIDHVLCREVPDKLTMLHKRNATHLKGWWINIVHHRKMLKDSPQKMIRQAETLKNDGSRIKERKTCDQEIDKKNVKRLC